MTTTFNGYAERNGYRVKVEQDLDPMPPSDWTDDSDVPEVAMFAEGNVWQYVIEKLETCDKGYEHAEAVDSLSSMYGWDYACETALEAFNAYAGTA